MFAELLGTFIVIAVFGAIGARAFDSFEPFDSICAVGFALSVIAGALTAMAWIIAAIWGVA